MKRCRTVLYMIAVCIVAIGFVSQAQLTQKEASSPLYEYRAAQMGEELGLAPSGSANSNLEFGSVSATELAVSSNAQTLSHGGRGHSSSRSPHSIPVTGKCFTAKCGTTKPPLPPQSGACQIHPPKDGYVTVAHHGSCLIKPPLTTTIGKPPLPIFTGMDLCQIPSLSPKGDHI